VYPNIKETFPELKVSLCGAISLLELHATWQDNIDQGKDISQIGKKDE
jgi:hypothetical protein